MESIKNIQYRTKVVTEAQVVFLKVPIGLNEIPYKLVRAYIKYLDCKAQSIEGIFKNNFSRTMRPKDRQHYRRVIKELLKLGWARPCVGGEDGEIALRCYQHVWRSLDIRRHTLKSRGLFKLHDLKRIGSRERFPYFKISIEKLSDERKNYYQEITEIIRMKIAERKRAQIRYRQRLNNGKQELQATFGARGAALLFGYKSPATGSKLRKKNFSVIETDEKPYFNKRNGRWENPCKLIAL